VSWDREPDKSRPTTNLRFVQRPSLVDAPRKVLQQMWIITEHRGGLWYTDTVEWRDVPLEEDET
jgi:hypothetical protein